MKNVYLVRHGKAESVTIETTDFKRSLIERGTVEARIVAARMHLLGLDPDLIVASPAQRALQTARIFAEETGYVKRNIVTRKTLYDQLPDAVFDILQTVDDEKSSVMIVGHNPTIEEVASLLVKGHGLTVPTSGVVAVRCKVDNWGGISPGSGKLLEMLAPGKLPGLKKSKLFKSSLKDSLERTVSELLMTVDEKAAKKTQKTVKAAVSEIAKRFIKQL